jgi:GNAT superfamily N-acetyltransferase
MTNNSSLAGIRIRVMNPTDLPLGLHLSRQAGWNQTEADWRRLLELQPDGCFVALRDGGAVGTTTTMVLGGVAWIAMVLVDEAARGQGVGTALLVHALEYLDRCGLATIRLDATPLGRPLYERLGFVEQFSLARYEGTLPAVGAVADLAAVASEAWEKLAALDEAVTGTDRRRLLLRLFAEQPGSVQAVHDADGPAGYLAARPGSKARQLGPCIASPAAGVRLFTQAWQRHGGQRVFLDIPLANEAACRLAESQGLAIQRRFTRMCRGTPRCERLEWVWASSGPEKG